MDTLKIHKERSENTPCTLLLPVYNGQTHIENCIKVLQRIARPIDEILIVNDGSTDKTTSLIIANTSQDKRFVLLNLPHIGLANALNEGLRASKNDLIARIDVDDDYPNNRIESQVKYLVESPNIAAVFTDYEIFEYQSHSLGKIVTAVDVDATKLSLISGFRSAHPSVMFRKAIVQEVGGYYQSDFPAEDLSLWLRMIRSYEIATIPQIMLFYQFNPSGISQTRKSEMIQKRNQLIGNFDFTDLVLRNVASYKKLKVLYKSSHSKYERLAIHNMELLIGLRGSSIGNFKKYYLGLTVLIRFISPHTFHATIGLFLDRLRRRKALYKT